MKKAILFILTTAAVLVFLSDHLLAQEKKKFNYTDFNKVSVGWGMLVNITQGSNYSIEVEADERDMKVLKVEKRGEELIFTFDKNNYRKKDDVSITIKMPALTDINLSGGTRGKISMNIASKNFSASLSGGSELEGDLTCGNADFSLSGGSTVKLNGKGNNIEAAGSGGSIFKLKGFSVKDVDADLSGGSNITVTMSGTLNTDQSGGSSLIYYGNAKMGNNDFSGGSFVSKGE